MRNEVKTLTFVCVIFVFSICIVYFIFFIKPLELEFEKQPIETQESIETSKQFGCNAYVSNSNSSGNALEELKSRKTQVYNNCPQSILSLSKPVHSMWVQDLQLDLLICAPYKSASSAVRFWWWRHYHMHQNPHDFWTKAEDHDWGQTRNALLQR